MSMKTSVLVSFLIYFSIAYLSCNNHRKADRTENLNIISYNIWVGYIDVESKQRLPLYHSGEKRKEGIYKWLKEQNSDVIFFQELIDYSGDKLMSESRFWGHKYAVTLRDSARLSSKIFFK